MEPRAGRGFLLAVAFFPLAASAAYAAPLVSRGAWGRFALLLYGALTILQLFALSRVRSEGSRRAVLLAGIASRILLVGAPAFTSRDVERYLWDGAVLLEGSDPYRLLPGDPSLDALRERFPPPRDNTDWPTIYPPAALAFFAAAAAAGPDGAFWIWKGIVTAASVGALLVVDRLLRGEGKPYRLALFSLSPLVVLEGGIGAHLDLLVLLFVVLGLLATQRGNSGRAGLAFGFASALKILPLVLLPLLFMRLRRGGWARFAAGAATAIALPYLLALAAGLRPIGNLFGFLRYWTFGSPLYSGILALGLPPEPSRIVLGGVALASLCALAVLAPRRPSGLLVRDGLAAVLLLSPVVFPWYLTLLVPTLALQPSLPLFAWTILHPLTYEVLDRYESTGAWAPASWPLVIVGAGAAAAFAFERFRRSRTG